MSAKNMFNVEISPSSRARCGDCNRIIKKGEKRLRLFGHYYGATTRHYRCKRCGIKSLKKEQKDLDKLIVRLRST